MFGSAHQDIDRFAVKMVKKCRPVSSPDKADMVAGLDPTGGDFDYPDPFYDSSIHSVDFQQTWSWWI